MVPSTKIDSACVQTFWAILGTNDAGCRRLEVTPQVVPSNLGTMNLFYYFFLQSDRILTTQTTKNQNMADTKFQTLKV